MTIEFRIAEKLMILRRMQNRSVKDGVGESRRWENILEVSVCVVCCVCVCFDALTGHMCNQVGEGNKLTFKCQHKGSEGL